jgi:quinol monooxygenase YgiN
MVFVHVRHQVEDYNKWRAGFDANITARKAGGALEGEYVMRDVENPNDVTIVLEWESVEKARQFTQSPELKEAMQNAGVTGPPEVRFLEAG